MDDSLNTEDDDLSVLEFGPDDEELQSTEAIWQTDNNCQRWIVIDGIKPSTDNKITANIDSKPYLQLILKSNEITPLKPQIKEIENLKSGKET